MYYGSGMYRGPQQNYQLQQACAAVEDGLNREAGAIDLYSRLAREAGDEEDRAEILNELEKRKAQFNHFGYLYASMTGQQPACQAQTIQFSDFADGVRKAQKAGEDAWQTYQQYSMSSPYPALSQAFQAAAAGNRQCAENFRHMTGTRQDDFGTGPYVVDIEQATLDNDNFRRALWTGDHLQLTLMSIEPGDDIGLEVHEEDDQFLRIEDGQGIVRMGPTETYLDFEEEVFPDYAIFIPAGTYHNVINTGDRPMKVYSIYAPPHHPFGTIHQTKADAEAAEAAEED
ncbi:cupin domain-containing protein [Alteribacter natronophilus]|uniref:cupin domain-containing protein n=1 Tax=Alteribacter natronophilus TaxID=2583810 RepID=UPI001FE3B04D|nr:cupin domain-containing protein [Alteribacter natronophilus]